MSFKNKVPVAVIHILEKVHAANSTLIKIVDPGSAVLKVVGTNGESGFFFTILQTNQKEGDKTVTYSVSISPFSNLHLDKYDTEISPDQVEKSLVRWVSLLKQYAKESPLFDDPIHKRYYDDFSRLYDPQIIDADADTAPYSFEQQGRVLELLEGLKAHVEKEVDPKDEAQVIEAELIKTEIQDIQKNISRKTKRWVWEKTKSLLARGLKISYSLGKVITTELMVELAKRLLIGGG